MAKTNKGQPIWWHQKRLDQLRTAATKACEQANEMQARYHWKWGVEVVKEDDDDTIIARGLSDDAVNWGDLSCVQARLCLTDTGEMTYVVYLEEAAPDATCLREFVRKQLKEKFGDVEVQTEW